MLHEQLHFNSNFSSASLINSFINIRMSLYTKKILKLFLESYSEDINLDFIEQNIGLSKFNAIRIFKKDCGTSPIKWLWICRTILSSQLIREQPDWNIKDISNICGFISSAHYCRCFKRIFHLSPTEYKKRCEIFNDDKPSVNQLIPTLMVQDIFIPKIMVINSMKLTNNYVFSHNTHTEALVV